MTPPTLHLIAAPLDHGVAEAGLPIADLWGDDALRTAAGLRHWVVEGAKTARAVLARVHAVVPLAVPIQAVAMVELPRPRKGGAPVPEATWASLLAPLRDGHDLGLMSEAGLPAIADPGARLVAAAHDAGHPVRVHPGASAIVLALAASGLNGQSFAFVGYLPVDAAERARELAALETRSRRGGQTQIVIETPYRNRALLDALVQTLSPSMRLAVGVSLGTARAWTRSRLVSTWRSAPLALPSDQPAVFCFGPG